LDALLLWNAEKAGAFVCEETQVTDVRWENRWEVFAKQNGRDAAFNADVFVGADGRNSIVAQKLSHEYSYVIKQPPKQKLTHLPKGYLRYLPSPDPATKRRDIPLPGIPLQRDSKSGTKNMKGRDYFFSRFIGRRLRGGHKTTERVGIQWHTHHQPSIRSTVEMFFFDSGYGGVVNVSPEHANVALVTSPSVAQLVRQDFSQFLERTLLNNPRAHKTFSNLDPTGEIYTTYPINPVAHSVHHPSAFLIGDARQTVEPFTGEGVYFALQDGIQTATKILQLLKKDAPSLAIKSRSRFLVNQVYSPLFRRYVVTGHLITAASRMPRLVSFVLRTVFS
ncbi:MAG: hypothetical protein HY088_01655, partial [Ignavibacteriales bacterium]|nr:hypothetical protein [Ignavibacteriales bacterium]